MAEVKIRSETVDRHIVEARGHKLICDQPSQNDGTDVGMTPTELLLGSLGACVSLYAASYCRNHGLAYEGIEVEVVSHTADDPPRRMGSIEIRLRMPAQIPDRLKAGLLSTARRCYVHNTLTHPPMIKVELEEQSNTDD